MSLLRLFYITTLFTFSSTVIALAAGNRDLIVQNELNCIDQHLQQNSVVTWNDVCDVSGSPSQEHIQAVNQQMDRLEAEVTPQNAGPQKVTPPGFTHQNWISDEVPPDLQKVHRQSYLTYEIAPEASYIKYVEHVGGSTYMKEKGDMYGINADITWRPPIGDMMNTKITDVYRVDGMFTYGKVNYYGGNSEGPESFDGINDYMVEIRGLTGKDFYFNDQSTRVTPYLGGGYRSLFDTMSENEPFGYNRRIQYLYLPFGSEVMTKLTNGWSIGADVEYDFFIRGFVTIYLGEEGLGDLTNTQKGGFGLRGSIKLIRNWDRFNFFFEPYVRFWDIHNSRVDQSTPFNYQGQEYVIIGYEPANTSLEMGGKLGIEF